MSYLAVHHQSEPVHPEKLLNDVADIAATLAPLGVRFERWEACAPLLPGAAPEEVIAAYRPQIDKLMAEEGYVTVDVVSLTRDHPQKAELRAKFLSEHTHGEDEVRFFVGGRGLFSLHVGERVYCVLCEKGDLISVPAGTPHWFDMGEEPHFMCIRLFNNPEGWVAQYSGDAIADEFPRLEP